MASETDTRAHEPEPTEAEARAHRRIWAGIIVGGVLVLIALGFLGYQQFSVRMEGANLSAKAEKVIQHADLTVVEVDEIVRSEVTTDLAARSDEVLARVPEAVLELEQAVVDLEAARPSTITQDRKRLDALAVAATARLHVLEHAPALLRLNAQASLALPSAHQAWIELLAADAKSDQAVTEYNKLSKAGVSASAGLNQQAAANLRKARELFLLAEKAFPDAPFETYVAYVDARIELNRLSRTSDRAWLKGDLKAANAASTSYNAADKRAVDLASQLPGNVDKAIVDAYEAAAKVPTDKYFEARDEAARADEKLRGL